MKLIFSAAVAFALFPTTAIAQPTFLAQWEANEPFCWMTRENGAVLNLSSMCGSNSGSLIPIAAEQRVASRPPAGSTCADFTNQLEAQYHFEQGTAPSSVDGDSDGIACEMLLNTVRSGGSRIATNSYTTGNRVELYRISTNNEYYLKVESIRIGTFTTRAFSDGQTALRYSQCYFADELESCSG